MFRFQLFILEKTKMQMRSAFIKGRGTLLQTHGMTLCQADSIRKNHQNTVVVRLALVVQLVASFSKNPTESPHVQPAIRSFHPPKIAVRRIDLLLKM